MYSANQNGIRRKSNVKDCILLFSYTSIISYLPTLVFNIAYALEPNPRIYMLYYTAVYEIGNFDFLSVFGYTKFNTRNKIRTLFII